VFCESVGEFFEGRAGGVFGGDLIVLDHGSNGVEDGGVVEGADVEEEDFGGFVAHLACGFFVECVEVCDGGHACEFEAFELGGGIDGIDGLETNAEGAVFFQEIDAPDDETFGDRDA